MTTTRIQWRNISRKKQLHLLIAVNDVQPVNGWLQQFFELTHSHKDETITFFVLRLSGHRIVPIHTLFADIPDRDFVIKSILKEMCSYLDYVVNYILP